jgi:hypothetical protein
VVTSQPQQLTFAEFQRRVDDAILPARLGGVPYQTHSHTSQAAAESVAPQRTKLEAEALDHFLAAGPAGLTDWELNERAGRSNNTGLAPRRVALEGRGLVVKTTKRRANPRTGRLAAVYVHRTYQAEQAA